MAEPQPTLPLDLTAAAATNLIEDEVHTLSVGDKTIAPNYGSFFTSTVTIVDALDNPLHPVTDYIALHLMADASAASNKEVCTVLHFFDHVTGNVKLNYQAIGGQYSGNVEQVRLLIEQAALDERPVTWGEILYLPNQFDPAAHMHHLGDLYGWEGVITMLEEIRQAIAYGDQASFQAAYNYMEMRFNEAGQARDLILQQIANLPNADVDTYGFSKKYNVADPNLDTDDVSFATPKLVHDKVKEKTHRIALYTQGETLLTVSANSYYEVTQINNAEGWVELRRSVTLFETALPVPDLGNLLYLQRISGSGPGNLHVKVLTEPTPDGAIFPRYTFRVSNNGRNTWVLGARYHMPIATPPSAFFGTGGLDPNINHIQRWADGRYIVNFKAGVFSPAGPQGFSSVENPVTFIQGACYDVNSSGRVASISIYRLRDYDAFYGDSYWENINEGYACLRVEHEGDGFINLERLIGHFYQN